MADIQVGRYLFERIAQLKIKTVFGVPGDYELVLLDMIPEAGLVWRGNPNELIASYAADGYARVNGAAAFVSTFGPGELSAYCGVAGQYTEYVPVVHIVGYPSTAAMKTHAIMHHSLGDGKFGMYHEMSRYITVASTVLDDATTAAAEIDRVLNGIYIGVAVDVGVQTISSIGLQSPLITMLPPNDPNTEAKVIREIINQLRAKKNTIVLVDGGAVRNDVIQETSELIKTLAVPYFVTAMSKGGISERLGLFGGVYAGGGSTAGVRAAVEDADLILFVGSYPFTEQIKPSVIVDFQRFTVNIMGVKYEAKMKYSIGRYLRPGDFVVAETGTSAFGIPAANLMNVDEVKMYNQTIFGSIGYAMGAALGSFIAGKENGSIRRGILITGEGSLQLTVQAMADYLRHEVNATIFILNNDGYTVERLIHGMEAPYNKIPDWSYSKMCDLFGPSFQSRYYLVKTGGELLKVLEDPEFNSAQCTQIVELVLGKHDAPLTVRLVTAAIEEFNRNKG
ncbi:putative pyruvate decarboxylase [Xylogone sp. PMI_703]|nr:putative pyruvate decarboxylase [Xylogone sp. PMI_703]